jgi:hypothetical protein
MGWYAKKYTLKKRNSRIQYFSPSAEQLAVKLPSVKLGTAGICPKVINHAKFHERLIVGYIFCVARRKLHHFNNSAGITTQYEI